MCRDTGCWDPALISAVPELTELMQKKHRGGRALAAARQELRAVAVRAGGRPAGPLRGAPADRAAEGRPQAAGHDGAPHAPALRQPGTGGLS